MTQKLRVLFLDIDGVINSTRTAVACGVGYPHELTQLDRFDGVALALIRKLCHIGELSVVLSSTWRMSFHYHKVANALDLPIIASTDTNGKLRGEEIARWLEANKDRVESYAIVDDDSDMLEEQMDRFVKTDGHEGLSWKNYSDLCTLFGVDVFADKPTRQVLEGEQ